jgi:hypothetical protein
MKAKVITAIIGLTVTTIVPAYANGIESPRGISQSAWNASSTYQNFQCPSGTSRGEGVDMNYTTDRSDDYWFVTCDPIVIYIPTTPTFSYPTPTVSETSTVTTVVTTPITNTETITATVNTSTSSSINTSSSTNTVTSPTLTQSQLITLILELFNKIIALLAQLK